MFTAFRRIDGAAFILTTARLTYKPLGKRRRVCPLPSCLYVYVMRIFGVEARI
uniref:Uncharacterized protein n=1 Tax=Arundo donax TaxID=35708 RepID=A0A0A9GA19_ARUDO